jgi:hypothetical protein
MDSITKKINVYKQQLDVVINKAKQLKRGDSVSWNSSGGTARGKITKVITSGSESVPNSSFKITGTPEDPGALIRVYSKTADGYEPTDTVVGHKLSTLTKISPLD